MLPDGPLFYVGPNPAWQYEWATAFIWDGLKWQPFKISDGTDWHVSTVPVY
jgi:hypothetical protein